jgi:hypothetical protein
MKALLLLIALCALAACQSPTAPAACTKDSDFTWTPVVMRNAAGDSVGVLLMGTCLRR